MLVSVRRGCFIGSFLTLYLNTDTRVGSFRPRHRREPLQRPLHRQSSQERSLWWALLSHISHPKPSGHCLMTLSVLQRALVASSSSSTGFSTRPGQRRETNGRSSGSLRTWWPWASAIRGTYLASWRSGLFPAPLSVPAGDNLTLGLSRP